MRVCSEVIDANWLEKTRHAARCGAAQRLGPKSTRAKSLALSIAKRVRYNTLTAHAERLRAATGRTSPGGSPGELLRSERLRARDP